MEFRILGPLEIVGEQGPVTLHRGKEQALLTFMLLHPNEVLASDRLIDELWDGRPPATAPKILQNAVSQLRRGLGDGRVETRAPGYVFHLAPDELDLHRFERLAREGRHEDALALWRGTPLLELREERFADDARRRFEDQRLAVVEDRIDADLAAGKHGQLVPELEQLVVEHPLRERMHGQLMRALYASGRQGDALEAYRRARRTLSEELGLEPGPQLQALERRILQQDPALAATAPSTPASRKPGRSPRRRALLLALVLAGVAAASAYALTRDGGHGLVAAPNSVVKIDAKTNRIVSVVAAGRRPAAIATVGRDLWVANSLDDTLTHVDLGSGETRTLGGFEYPTSLAAEGKRVWVGNNSRGVLVAIDSASGTVSDRLQIRDAAAATFLAYGADSIWISEEEAGIHRVSLSTRAVTTPVPDAPVHELAFGDGAVWFAVAGQREIRRIDPNDTTSRRIAIGGLASGIAVGFGAVWVASAPSDTVWKVDPAIGVVSDVVHVGRSPEGVAVAAGSVWVANNRAGTVSRIDPETNEVVATVRTGYFPLAVADAGDGVWVTVAAAPEPSS
jgi:YVTN family beta-propeller protein